MKLTGLMPARNEDWVIGLSARVALMWCDELIVLNHASTDRTAEILAEIQREDGRLRIIETDDPVWYEMAHRQRLLDEARERGASHIALVDADEVLTGNLVRSVRGEIQKLEPGRYMQTRMFACWRGIDYYRHDASVWSRRRDLVLAVGMSSKLRWASDKGYDHHQRPPRKSEPGMAWLPDGGVMHLQFANWRRLRAKHALYKVTERIRWPWKTVEEIDKMYSLALDERGLGLMDVPVTWWQPYAMLLDHLRLDGEPWQEAECRRLVAEHGAQTFVGLNLFGVA